MRDGVREHQPLRRGGFAPALAACALLVACGGELLDPSATPVPTTMTLADGGVVPVQPGTTPPVITGTTAPLDCKDVNVGITPLQRLSRTQFANSVRDLLHLTVFDISVLGQDEKVGVFDGNTVAPVGDLEVEQYMTAAERAALAAMPALESLVACDRTKLGDPACATQFIGAFGQRAYRRPLLAEELAAYQALYGAYAMGRSYPEVLRVIVQTMLQSPSFLYHIELVPTPAGAAAVVALDPYELAARTAFFLTSTTPDDALLAAAQAGALSDPAGLGAQVDRLLAEPHVSDTIAGFHLQWLELDKLDGLTKDATLFASFTPALVDAMRRETTRFVDYVIRKDDAKLETLLTAPYSFPEGGLLSLYGVQAGAADTPVQLDKTQRAGILTQPSFLALHAHYNQSAPVQRGKVIIRNVLCAQLPDPPPNVDTTPPEPSTSSTLRERLTQHQTDPSCAGCHKRIDGIGLGFEQYDAIGAFRSMEAGKPVDASGEIVGTQTLDGPFNGVIDLAHKLADSEEVQACVVSQWLRFALGRFEADADACSQSALQKSFAASGHDIRALLKSIVSSDSFRMKRVAPEATTGSTP